MNETLKKILYTIAAIYFIISIIGGTVLYSRLERTRQQLDYTRAELEHAQNRQQEAFDTIDECYRNVERASEVLSQSVNTVQGIRKQISEIKENYEYMENRMLQFYDNIHRTNSSTVFNQIEGKNYHFEETK